jgi:adenylate kinase
MERGVLVPDDVTIKMVMGWVSDHEGEGGFLLDGFPRTPGQAEALDQVMADQGGIDRAVNIKVSRAELVRRLAGRLICRNCQTSYHKKFAPPRSEDECDLCGGELYQRDDDRPEAVEKRIQVYMDETAPLVEYYRRSGILREVDGEGAVERVGDAIMDALNAGAGRLEPP